MGAARRAPEHDRDDHRPGHRHRQARLGARPGLRPDVAEDVHRAGPRRRALPRGRGRPLEGRLPDVLAQGLDVLRAAGRHHARRGRAVRRPAGPRLPGEDVDGHPRDLRRQRVVHVHDARGSCALRMDHVLRLPGRRRDGRAGPGPGADERPVHRADLHVRREPGERPVLGADAREPGPVAGCRRTDRRVAARSASTSSRQWKYVRNVRHSAAINMAVGTVTGPRHDGSGGDGRRGDPGRDRRGRRAQRARRRDRARSRRTLGPDLRGRGHGRRRGRGRPS